VRIGVVARAVGVTEAAIRFYERSRVLPEPARTRSGYRDFGEHDVELLRFIRAGQAVGLTLAELREVIAFRQRGEVPCAHMIELINSHAARIDEQIGQLRRVQYDLRTLAERAETLDPADCSPESICHVVVDPATLPAATDNR
jgi:DNA-binding transcriptional MerR regulator